jgi:hypothetical protein
MTSSLPLSLYSGIALFCLAQATLAQDATIEHSRTDQTTKTEAHLGKTYTMKFKLTTTESRRCQVRATMDFFQKNTMAKVDSLLENEDCGASSGSYTVSIRYRDGSGELQRVEYEETWQREDDQPITITKEYFAGDNVDITRVQPKNLRCLCAKAIPNNENPDTEIQH